MKYLDKERPYLKSKTKSKTSFKTNAIVTNTIYCYFTKNVSTYIAFKFMAMSLVMYQEIYLSQAQIHIYNPRTQKTEARRHQVQVLARLQSEFKAQLGSFSESHVKTKS